MLFNDGNKGIAPLDEVCHPQMKSQEAVEWESVGCSSRKT